MKDITLVIGGCRSGKSRHALEMAEQVNARRQIFVATCQPGDDEMHRRVQQHRQQRSDRWQTVEEPLELATAIRTWAAPQSIVLIDCLTMWVSNTLLEVGDNDPQKTTARTDRLVKALQSAPGPVILVTNEVGAGIVPENRLARRFRDAAGSVNQQVAAVATCVFWMVAGIAVKVK